MSYTPTIWRSGDKVTSTKLNKIEQGIKNNADNFYVTVEEVEVFDGSVTTTKNGNYYYTAIDIDNDIEYPQIKVTFDGTEYTVDGVSGGANYIYGTFGNYTTYPFYISGKTIYTQSAGTYDLKIIGINNTVTVSEDFENAVHDLTGNIYKGTGHNAVVANSISNVSSGGGSFSEGFTTTASGRYSHAEGYGTRSSGLASHAEGSDTVASGEKSHCEGYWTVSAGYASHADGMLSESNGMVSHSSGNGTIADGRSQFVVGEYNVAQGTASSKVDTDYAFIIGNGTNRNNRSNAFAVRWDGAFVFANGTVITPDQFAQLLALITNE